MNEYEKYQPHINAAEGIKRIMGNKKLYITMLGRFKLREMTDAVAESIQSDDHEKRAFAVHALKGTAGNLGLPTLYSHTAEMEQLAKEQKDITHLMPPLEELVSELAPLIEMFITAEV